MNKLLEINTDKAFTNTALSTSSQASYKQATTQYHVYLNSTGQPESPDSIKAFLHTIQQTKKPATYNLRMQALKTYLLKKYETDHKQLFGIQELFKGIKRMKVEQAVLSDNYLTKGQIGILTSKMTDKVSLILQALFWTGCRVSELINIKHKDIVLNGKAVIKIVGKGNKEHTVYMPLSLYTRIVKTFEGIIYLFETANIRKYNKANIHKEIKRQGKKYGYEIHPHTLRHSKAMYLKDDKKLSADQIAKALGHSNVATTLTYYFHGTPSASDQGIEDDI